MNSNSNYLQLTTYPVLLKTRKLAFILKEDNIWRKLNRNRGRRFWGSPRERFPAPPFQRWAHYNPRSSPRGQKFGETEPALRPTPTLKLGGGGSDPPQPHQRTCRSSFNTSIQSVSPNFVLLPNGPSPSSPKNQDGPSTRGQLRGREHKMLVGKQTPCRPVIFGEP